MISFVVPVYEIKIISYYFQLVIVRERKAKKCKIAFWPPALQILHQFQFCDKRADSQSEIIINIIIVETKMTISILIVRDRPVGYIMRADRSIHQHIHGIIIIIIIWPKPPYGRESLEGSWGNDTVRQVHYKVFLTSHFTPSALSSDVVC